MEASPPEGAAHCLYCIITCPAQTRRPDCGQMVMHVAKIKRLKERIRFRDRTGTPADRGAKLQYEPLQTRRYNPPIGLIGCGGITETHLRAYRKAGFNVVVLCDRTFSKAEARRIEFFPRGRVNRLPPTPPRGDIEVVDIATHPDERVEIVTAALRARKHMLSQKPFVTDLLVGQRLVELADRQKVRLAVNQNGRWAPHFNYIRAAIENGLIGQVFAAHLSVHWNHDWTAGTAFDRIPNLVLFDFAIHWFDIVRAFLPALSRVRVRHHCSRGRSESSLAAAGTGVDRV